MNDLKVLSATAQIAYECPHCSENVVAYADLSNVRASEKMSYGSAEMEYAIDIRCPMCESYTEVEW